MTPSSPGSSEVSCWGLSSLSAPRSVWEGVVVVAPGLLALRGLYLLAIAIRDAALYIAVMPGVGLFGGRGI